MTALRESGALATDQCLDVHYADLMQRPFETLAGIYDHFGLEFASEAETRMRAYLNAKPKGRHGAHAYDFADTGLDADQERERFRAYYERYGVAVES